MRIDWRIMAILHLAFFCLFIVPGVFLEDTVLLLFALCFLIVGLFSFQMIILTEAIKRKKEDA